MTPLIATHAFLALASLMLGGWQLFVSKKGTPAHRLAGRVWVASMLFVAVSSFWITEIREGRFSFLHVLSVVTIVTVSLGVLAAVRGNIESHRGNMTGSWIGLTFAFVFAIAIPQRAVPTFVVTDPVGAALAFTAVVMTTSFVVALAQQVEAQKTRRTVTSSATRHTGR